MDKHDRWGSNAYKSERCQFCTGKLVSLTLNLLFQTEIDLMGSLLCQKVRVLQVDC